MQKKINPIIGWACVLLLFAVFYFYVYWHNKRYDERILKNVRVTNGVFVRVEYTKGSRFAIYNYEVQGKLYASSIGTGAVSKVWAQIQGQHFPVIYNSENPKECNILVFRWDFERYKLPYPDSIQWVQVLYDRAR